MLKEIKDYLTIEKDRKIVLKSFIITCIICFVSYSAFIVYNFASPDGILEGYHFYIDRDWALGGCGRWSLIFVNMLHANLVLPWLTIVECVLINWLSANTINKLLDIKNKYLYCLSCVLFAIIPPIIEIYTYTFTSFAYCLSIFLSILFVYFNSKQKYIYSILAGILLGFAMGMYQAQIGIAVGLSAIYLIKRLIENKDSNIKYILLTIGSGLLSIIVYVLGLFICLNIFNITLIDRASTFSIIELLSKFNTSFIESYRILFVSITDAKPYIKVLYLIMTVLFIIEFINLVIKQIKNKKYFYFIIITLLICLLPPFINIIKIILPSYEITSLMMAPEYILVFFVIYLVDYLNIKYKKIIIVILSLSIAFLSWTYVLSANATYESYKLSYNVYKDRMSSALDEVYELDDYHLNKTKIVVVGHPSDEILRSNINTYKYAVNLPSNLLYWNNDVLDSRTTNQYIINEFGVDPGVIEYNEYVSLLSLDEVYDMPSWPEKGYVQMIKGYAVIKFSDIYE